jgi:hypothetical protein
VTIPAIDLPAAVRRRERALADEARPRPPFWLWLTFPLAGLALVASVLGILVDSVYGKETDVWAAQAVGQDIANLVAFPVLVGLALAARRGSLHAYLALTGLLGYSAYMYGLYAFDVHFGRLFLVYVAAYGLSVYALGGALTSLDASRVRETFGLDTPLKLTARLLIALSALFYVLWLSIEVPAAITGNAPDELVDTGLFTNGVHVIDLALFLPAMGLTGVLLARRRAWGFVFAPAVLGTGVPVGVGIVASTVVLATRGLDHSWPVAIIVALLTVVEVGVLWRFVAAILPETRLEDGLRQQADRAGQSALCSKLRMPR